MPVQAKLGTVATIVVNVNTPGPVPAWDKTWNKTVYNPYALGSVGQEPLTILTNSATPLPPERSASGPGLSGISYVNSSTNRKPVSYQPVFDRNLLQVSAIDSALSNRNQIPPPAWDTTWNKTVYNITALGTVVQEPRTILTSSATPIPPERSISGPGLPGISYVNSTTNKNPVRYQPVFNRILNTVYVTSYNKGDGGLNQKRLPPTVTEGIFNRVVYDSYGFGTTSNNYNRSSIPGLPEKQNPISGASGFAASISVSTSTRASFRYNLSADTVGAVVGSLNNPQVNLTVTSNYSNTVIFNKTVSIDTSTDTVPNTIPHVYFYPVISRRENDFGPRTLYNRLNIPITTAVAPLISKSLLDNGNNVIPSLTQQQSQNIYVRRLSDLGPKTLTTQVNGIKSTIPTTTISPQTRNISNVPIYIRRMSDLGPKTLNTQLNGIKIEGTPTPLYTVAVPGSYNIIISPNATVVGYWS